MRNRLTLPVPVIVLVAGAALTLSACGTTEEAADPAAASATPTGGPVTVTDDRGTVTLDGPATKVVSLEWGLTENLLTFALVRGVEYYDAPAIRSIVNAAEKDGYKFSSLLLGIVKSAPFQMRRAEAPPVAGKTE